MDPGAVLMVAGGGPVLSARGAAACNRISGQELTEEGGRIFAGRVYEAKVRKLEAWEQFKVFSPGRPGAQAKDLVDTRWAPTWMEVDGVKTAKARLAA